MKATLLSWPLLQETGATSHVLRNLIKRLAELFSQGQKTKALNSQFPSSFVQRWPHRCELSSTLGLPEYEKLHPQEAI